MIAHQSPPPPTSTRTLPPGSVEVVNALFKELQAIFPAWKQAWPDTESLRTAKRSWIKAFIAEGINQLEQIRFGVERCRSLGTDFAPSVGKFIQLCQPTPEMLGIPPHNKAFREALENAHPSRFGGRTWSHPAIRHAALQCEMHNLGDLAPDKASKIFDRAYDITIRQLVQGKPLEDIALGIGYDGEKSEVELAEEHGEWRQQQLMSRQVIPANGQDARRALLARFGLECRP
ncbi:replication protein P [Pseudomonas sp. GD03860]|uniref:replication protein P n=1 Tax=Pseudomonas sp. GD03860 TaxID=2975389 RepID=UPI00244B1136|nr:replication protein P [Pseudomonas sp. GD03860]MDH0640639.1 replication protein P [Pseudomonas sp. GD03860]